MKFENIKDYLLLSIKLILVISITKAVYDGLWHIMSINILLLAILFTPTIIKSVKINIPVEFEWMLLFFSVITLIIGQIDGLIVPIFFGIGIGFLGFFIMLILYSNNQIKKNYFLIILFSFNLAITFAFGLEFSKYYLKIFLSHDLNAAVYAYSMQMMTYVTIGALISSGIGYIYMKGYKGFIGNIVERFRISNPDVFKKQASTEEILEIIKKGENEETEFKSTLRLNIHTNEVDKKIEFAVIKTIAAFMNSKGGKLILGVSDTGEITGIEKDRFENYDRFSLHLTNLIKEKIGKNFSHLIIPKKIEIEEKIIVEIECRKSNKQIFVKNALGEEEFFIRAGPSSNKISGSELIDYIKRRFSEKV